jgi:hypothetical protein
MLNAECPLDGVGGVKLAGHEDVLGLREEVRLGRSWNDGLRERDFVVMEPTDQGALKQRTGPDEVCVLLMAVAKGGFCWVRWPVKKLGLS